MTTGLIIVTFILGLLLFTQAVKLHIQGDVLIFTNVLLALGGALLIGVALHLIGKEYEYALWL